MIECFLCKKAIESRVVRFLGVFCHLECLEEVFLELFV